MFIEEILIFRKIIRNNFFLKKLNFIKNIFKKVNVLNTNLPQYNFKKPFLQNLILFKWYILNLFKSSNYINIFYKIQFYTTLYLNYIRLNFNKFLNFNNFYIFIKNNFNKNFFFYKNTLDLSEKYKKIFNLKFLNYKYIFIILFNTFKYKSLDLWVEWLNSLFNSVNLFYHQKIILFLKYFLKLFSLTNLNFFNITGFFLIFKGKISVTGSSRKKKLWIKYKTIGTSYKLNYKIKKLQIRTSSGMFNITSILGYLNN